jgi:ABC-type Fe3+/spermidine/putrescine transport system ATPase subunit
VKEYTVLLTWDDEAHVWVAENDSIPVALEAESFDTLIERVRHTVPEVLQENNKSSDVYLNFITHRREKAYTCSQYFPISLR